MNNCTCNEFDAMWESVDRVNAGELVEGVIAAAQAQVDYSRAQNAARRYEVLLGKNGARTRIPSRALLRPRVEQLKNVKQSYAQFVSGLGKDQKNQVSRFIRGGGLKELADNARRTAVLSLLDEDLSPEEAQKTMKSLEATLGKIARLSSFDKFNQYLDSHLDELIAKKFGNPSAFHGLCILILIITSVFAVLVLIAALICALTLGLACQDSCNGCSINLPP
jgi:hypothetical protein